MAVPSVVLTASATINSSSVALTITGTVNVDDVVYVVVSAFNGGQTTTGVTCTGSTNAQRRWPRRTDDTIRTAWATISTLTINPVFTMTFSGGMNGAIGAIVVRGAANPTDPFDACPEFPIMRGSIGTDDIGNNFGTDQFGISAPFSTFNNDSLLIFGAFANNGTLLTSPSGFTQQVSIGPSSALLIATEDAPTPVSNLRATTSSGPNQRCVADAIAGQAFTAGAIPYAIASASGGGGLGSYTLNIKGTALSGDVVYVLVSSFNGAASISSVSCTGSSNATIRHTGFNNAINAAWATINTTTVNPAFTLNMNTSGSLSVCGIIVRGARNPTSPFDSSTSNPNEVGGATGSWTTNDPNALLIYGGFLNNGNNEIIPPTGWKVYNWDYSGPNVSIASLDAPTQVSGLSATATGSISGLSPFTYTDAISGSPSVNNSLLQTAVSMT